MREKRIGTRALARIAGVTEGYIRLGLLRRHVNPAEKYAENLRQLGYSEVDIGQWRAYFENLLHKKYGKKKPLKLLPGRHGKRKRLTVVKEPLNLDLTPELSAQIAMMSARMRERFNSMFAILKKAQEKGVLDATPRSEGYKELKHIIDAANAGGGGNIKYQNFKKIVKKIRENGMQNYIDSWGDVGAGRRGKTNIKKEDLDCFISLYASDNYPSLESAYKITLGKAASEGRFDPQADNFPCAQSFLYWTKKLIGQEALDRIRKGEGFWKGNGQSSVVRDTSAMRVMQVLVGDCMTCDTDVRILNTKLKKASKFRPRWVRVRPYLTAWMDYRTARFVGYSFHLEAENTGHILSTLRTAISRFGKPEMIYVDNGKTYANRELERILPALGIEKKHATVKNSDAKFIERMFGIYHQEHEKLLPGYVGVTKLRTPESTALLRKNIEKDKDVEKLLTFEEYAAKSTKFIEEVMAKRVFADGERAGTSPLSVWNGEYDERNMTFMSEKSLALLLARSTAFSVSKHTINDSKNGVSYYAGPLENGQKVYLRRAPEDLSRAYAYDECDRFLCVLEGKLPVAAIYRTETERQEVVAAIQQNRKYDREFISERLKIVKEAKKKYALSPDERLEAQKAYNEIAAKGLDHSVREVKKIITLTSADLDIAKAKAQEEEGTRLPASLAVGQDFILPDEKWRELKRY